MLNDQQYAELLKPLDSERVAKRAGGGGKSLSYLEAWDVKAHLNRIFGFLNWSADVISADLVFEEKSGDKWSVGYKVVLRLTIGREYPDATYTEAAVGSSIQGSRGEAHDMAVKTAESDALKRAAINLGTQFGLSLYDNGSLKDVIGHTLDKGTPPAGAPAPSVTPTSVVPADNDGSAVWIEEMRAAVEGKDVPALLEVKKRMNEEGVADWLFQGVTLAKWLDKAIAQAGKN